MEASFDAALIRYLILTFGKVRLRTASPPQHLREGKMDFAKEPSKNPPLKVSVRQFLHISRIALLSLSFSLFDNNGATRYAKLDSRTHSCTTT